MKKTYALLFILILAGVYASIEYYPPSSGGMPFVTSVDQYYQVMFDEEGEAIVTLRLIVRNQDEDTITNLNLEVPGRNIRLLGVVQETTYSQSQTCIRWDTTCLEYGEGETCVRYDYNGNCAEYQKPCLKSGRACAQYSTNYNYQPSYQKIDVAPQPLANSVSIPITLVNPVQKNGQTNMLIVYKAEDYVDSMLGMHNFKFETIRMPFDSPYVRVASSVQSGLHMKDSGSNVNYLPTFNTFTSAMESDVMGEKQSMAIHDYSRTVMYAGGNVKTAQYLDPHESFTVKGSYSRSWLRLYCGRIVAVLLGFVLFLAGIIYAAKKLFQKLGTKKKKEHAFLVPFLSGLMTALTIVFLWIFVIIIVAVFGNFLGYGAGTLIGLLLMLLMLFLSLALMIGVPIYIGSEYGPLAGFFTVMSIFGWLIVFAIVAVSFIGIFSRTVYYY